MQTKKFGTQGHSYLPHRKRPEKSLPWPPNIGDVTESHPAAPAKVTAVKPFLKEHIPVLNSAGA
jgi:hypothetical protein